MLLEVTPNECCIYTLINNSLADGIRPQFKLVLLSDDRSVDLTCSQDYFTKFRSYNIQLGENFPWGVEPLVDDYFNISWPLIFEQSCRIKSEDVHSRNYAEIFENHCNKYMGYLFAGCSNLSFIAAHGMLSYNQQMQTLFKDSSTPGDRMDIVFHGTSSLVARKILASGLMVGTRNFHGITRAGYTTPMLEKAYQFARDTCFRSDEKGAIVVIKMRVGNCRIKDVNDRHCYDKGKNIDDCDTLLIRTETKMSTCMSLCNNLPKELYWQAASNNINDLLPIGIIEIGNQLI